MDLTVVPGLHSCERSCMGSTWHIPIRDLSWILLYHLDQKLWIRCSVMFFLRSTLGLSTLMFVKRTERYKDTEKIIYIHIIQIHSCSNLEHALRKETMTPTKTYRIYMELYLENCKMMTFDLLVTQRSNILSCLLNRWSPAFIETFKNPQLNLSQNKCISFSFTSSGTFRNRSLVTMKSHYYS